MAWGVWRGGDVETTSARRSEAASEEDIWAEGQERDRPEDSEQVITH